MPMFNKEAQTILNYTLKGTGYIPTTEGWLALFTAPLTAEDDGSTGEVSVANWATYVRQKITFAVADTGGNTIKNSAVITFPANATAASSTIVAVAISGAVSGSSTTAGFKYYSNLCKPIIVNNGDPQLSWAVGALTIRIGAE